MCTSIVVNANKTIVGWNLDILDMKYRVSDNGDSVTIDIKDAIEGWLPLFGCNDRGDFVGMPTCWPYDSASDSKTNNEPNIIMLDIDLLTKKKTFNEIKVIASNKMICSMPNITYMSSLSDCNGNVLHIVPGQGYKYYEKPKYSVLTNFSPFKMDKDLHPWMGLDRYNKANEFLAHVSDNFDVTDCFEILKQVSQTVCPTVVSMVFDVTENIVYWCMNQKWDNINKKVFKNE